MKKENLNNVADIEGVPNMIEINEEDSNNLIDSISETNASKELVDIAQKDMEITPIALQILIKFYIANSQKHQRLWRDLLNKYAGVDFAAEYKSAYRFDVQRKVIFLSKQNLCNCSVEL